MISRNELEHYLLYGTTTGLNLGPHNTCLRTRFSIRCISSISFRVHVRTDDAYNTPGSATLFQ